MSAKPEVVLAKMGACKTWLHHARGKTWRQLFDFARAVGPTDAGGRFWLWLAFRLDPSWRSDGSADGGVCEKTGLWGSCSAHSLIVGCLPFDAWLAALRAAGRLGGEK